MPALGVNCLLLMSLIISAMCSAPNTDRDSLLLFEGLPNKVDNFNRAYPAAEKSTRSLFDSLQELQVHTADVRRGDPSHTTTADRKNKRREATHTTTADREQKRREPSHTTTTDRQDKRREATHTTTADREQKRREPSHTTTTDRQDMRREATHTTTADREDKRRKASHTTTADRQDKREEPSYTITADGEDKRREASHTTTADREDKRREASHTTTADREDKRREASHTTTADREDKRREASHTNTADREDKRREASHTNIADREDKRREPSHTNTADREDTLLKRREAYGSERGSGSGLLLDTTPRGENFAPLNECLSPLTLFTLFDSLLGDIVIGNVSTECRRGWGELFNSTDSSGYNNGIRALDAFGKLGAGYLEGNVHALGRYDECFSIPGTQYCLSELTIESTALELYYAFCLPQTCSEDDIRMSVNLMNFNLQYRPSLFQVGSVRCESDHQAPYNGGAIVMIFVWCLFGAMVIIATAFHIAHKKMEQRTKRLRKNVEIDEEAANSSQDAPQRKTNADKARGLLLTFSLYETVPKIFSVKKQPQYAITCLHGIRVISMFWIILSHVQLWPSFFASNRTSYIRDTTTRFSYRVLPSGILAVDSFLLMSGLLVTYLTLRQLNKRKGKLKFTLSMYYIHRILRLTPVYIFVLFTYWFLTVHLADGPVWQQTVGTSSVFYKSCEKYWWTNVLFINNIFPRNHINICMPWTWYLANDMQFYILAPTIIVALFSRRYCPIGLTMIGLLVTMNLAIRAGITAGYGFSANVAKFEEVSNALSDDTQEEHNITDDLYTKPWTRVGPYLIGILMGFIFYKGLKPNFRKSSFNQIFYVSLWILAAGLYFSTVYGVHSTISEDKLSKAEDVTYQTFSRFAWSIGVACITYTCHNGYGWIVNDFLSMRLWIPLSRLTYVAYLVHGIVLFVLVFSNREPYYGTDIASMTFSITTAVLSFGAAAVISSFVEFPLINLQNAIFKLAGLEGRDSVRSSRIVKDECVVESAAFEDVNEDQAINNGQTECNEGQDRGEGGEGEERVEGGEGGEGGDGNGERERGREVEVVMEGGGEEGVVVTGEGGDVEVVTGEGEVEVVTGEVEVELVTGEGGEVYRGCETCDRGRVGEGARGKKGGGRWREDHHEERERV